MKKALFLLVFMGCAHPIVRECPIDIPEVWRHPLYEKMTTGYKFEGNDVCLTDADHRRALRNAALCETIRRGIIDFLDDIANSPH